MSTSRTIFMSATFVMLTNDGMALPQVISKDRAALAAAAAAATSSDYYVRLSNAHPNGNVSASNDSGAAVSSEGGGEASRADDSTDGVDHNLLSAALAGGLPGDDSNSNGGEVGGSIIPRTVQMKLQRHFELSATFAQQNSL